MYTSVALKSRVENRKRGMETRQARLRVGFGSGDFGRQKSTEPKPRLPAILPSR
jgi:hypothetical protein